MLKITIPGYICSSPACLIMDEFVNSLDTLRFEKTNGLWNELMLNDPWSVGYVTMLIETKGFATKEDWESFYYESGNARAAKLTLLAPDLRQRLDDEQWVKQNKPAIRAMDWGTKSLNFHFGRTPAQLARKGTLLFEEGTKRGIAITEAECIEAVRFRTICQTWNGVIIRERLAIRALSASFPDSEFRKTSGEFDYRYAVDYELFKDSARICGIQIKPNSYAMSQASYVLVAGEANRRKNAAYQQRFQCPVFEVIFEKGQVVNAAVIEEIRRVG